MGERQKKQPIPVNFNDFYELCKTKAREEGRPWLTTEIMEAEGIMNKEGWVNIAKLKQWLRDNPVYVSTD